MHIQGSGVVQLYAEAKSQRASPDGSRLPLLSLSLPIFLFGSRIALSLLRPFGFVARSSLIENQNSGELIEEGIRRDRGPLSRHVLDPRARARPKV